MNILIIGGERQPIPPIKGGAVENLVKLFYDENEIEKKININVISCYDNSLNLKNNRYGNYNNTKFYMVNSISNNSILFQKLNSFLKRLFGLSIISSSNYIKKVIDTINENNINFDSIIVENYIEGITLLRKEFPDKKIFLHLHNDKLDDKVINGKKIVKSCDKIITVSDYIKNRVCTIKEAKEKTEVLINSIFVDNFGKDKYKDDSIKLKEKFDISKKDVVLIFAGRISKTKGVKELIEALILLKNESFKLLIVGNSWYGTKEYNDNYLNEIKELSEDIKNKIIFTGYVDYTDIPKYYAIADIAIIPSIWQEPCSLTLFESMASGLPLITTKTGGTPEVVKDKALLVDVDENIVINLSKEITKLINNKIEREKLGKDAYEYIQQYNPERYYRKMLEIIYNKGNI